MTGIPADNNFKDFLKVDLFTLKIWGHQELTWDWDTLMHRRSLPNRSGILLVLLTCAKILSSTVGIWSRFFRSRLRNFARFVILRLVFISINLRQAVPDACVFNLRPCWKVVKRKQQHATSLKTKEMFYSTTFVLQTFLIASKLHATWYNNIQHDTTTYSKVVKRYKLFLHNKCCKLLYEKLGSFDRAYLKMGISHLRTYDLKAFVEFRHETSYTKSSSHA